MKKPYIKMIQKLFFISICSLFIHGCDKKNNEPKKIVYDVPKQTVEVVAEEDQTKNSLETEIETNNKDQNTTLEDSVLVKDSEYWSALPEFHGIETDEDNLLLSNYEPNVRYNPAGLSLMCIDTNNETIYYVNHDNDDYIYQLEGDKSTLLIEKKATYLQIYNEELYFISGDNPINRGMRGNIYKYNLKTKELILVLEGNVFELWVNEDGIYYYEVCEDNYIYCYHLGFDSGLPIKADEYFFLHYRDYRIHYSDKGILVKSLTSGEDQYILPESVIDIHGDQEIKIFEDVLYVSNNGQVYATHLLTGERKIYNFDLYEGMRGKTTYKISSFTFCDNMIYVAPNSSILLGADLETGIARDVDIRYETSVSPVINELYTDGERLFGLAKQSMYEISVEEGYGKSTGWELCQ